MTSSEYGLLDSNWPDLNRRFYQSDPYDYFLTRWELLMLFAGRVDDLAELISEGITVGSVRMGVTGDPSVTESAERRALQQRFVAAESEVLLFHTVETLLRLYLAHEDRPLCPWLELSRLRYGFRAALVDRFSPGKLSTEERRARTARLIFGRPLGDSSDIVDEIDHAEATLRWFSDLFLRGANRYNSAKHGLSVVPVEEAFFSLQLHDPQAPPLEAKGPAVHFLEKTTDPPRWQATVAWVDVEHNLTAQHVATLLIRNIWNVARALYADGPSDGQMLVLPQPLSEILGDPNHGPISTFSMHLQYDLTVRPDLTPPQRQVDDTD